MRKNRSDQENNEVQEHIQIGVPIVNFGQCHISENET